MEAYSRLPGSNAKKIARTAGAPNSPPDAGFSTFHFFYGVQANLGVPQITA